jgi:putative flippase GtrA
MPLVKYFFVGAAAAVVDISLFIFFANYLGWHWIPVSICTFLLATLVNYLLSIRFVFESGARHLKHIEIIGVFTISTLALLINQIVLFIAIEWFGWHFIISKIIATSAVFFWNYFGRSRLIF